MPTLTINGRSHACPKGASILQACHEAGVQVPTLCHDERLAPSGACRLCVVSIQGWDRHASACNTRTAEGMVIETDSDQLREIRSTLLGMLAQDYPRDALERFPEKPFNRLLREYGVPLPSSQDLQSGHGPGSGGRASSTAAQFQDTTHPYLRADFDQCITCFRCVRACDELQGQFVWRAWNRGADTRIRPGASQTLLSSNCVSCGACVDTCPTGALEDQSVFKLGQPVDWTRTTCPYCGVGCEMNVGTRDGRIVQVKPVLDAPVSRGHLCVKGRYAYDYVRAKDRVTAPMIRESGGWRSVTWEEAIQHVAARFRSLLEASGPARVGMLGSARATNEESYLTQKFARVVLGTNNVDCCARVCHAPTAAGMRQMLGTGAATNSFADIETARCFLVTGCNPTENHPIVGARIKQAVLRGAKLVVIDPRAIELVQYAQVHLQLRPGTNIPIFHALAHVIVAEGLCDAEALRERIVEFEQFRRFIGEWPPERVAGITGVDAERIREAARVYAGESPAMCFHGLGVTEHTQGTDGVMALVNLALLTGNFGKPGSGVNPLRGQNNVQGSAHMGCEPGNLTGFVPLESGRESFEAVWKAPVPRTPGLNLLQMIDAAAEDRFDALWAIGYDVALTNPDANATRRALGRLRFVVVQDLFMNELAREFGHVFLPACSSFEKEGTFMNSERRVQRVRKVFEPVGGSLPDWQILCRLADAMGFGAQFAFHSSEEIWNEVRSLWPAGAGISYSRLEPEGLQWPCPTEGHPGTAILHTETFPNGKRAALKRIPFAPTLETTDGHFPFLLTTGRTLYQFNAGTMTMRTPDAVLRETDTLDMSPLDAAKLGLSTGDRVRVRSRYGETVLPLREVCGIKPGELFATFHTVKANLNLLTSPLRDNAVSTPEYKVVAVAIEKDAVYV